MKSRLPADVVVLQRAVVLELPASENQALLVGGDILPVLDQLLDGGNSVRPSHLEGKGLTSKGLDKDGQGGSG